MTLPMLFADTDPNSKPWPEEVVDSLNGHMTVLVVDGKRLYCVRDWVYVVSGSTNANRGSALNELKRAMKKRGDTFVEKLLQGRVKPVHVTLLRGEPAALDLQAYAGDHRSHSLLLECFH